MISTPPLTFESRMILLCDSTNPCGWCRCNGRFCARRDLVMNSTMLSYLHRDRLRRTLNACRELFCAPAIVSRPKTVYRHGIRCCSPRCSDRPLHLRHPQGFATINDEIMSSINITYGGAMMAGQTYDSLRAQAAQENKTTTNVDGGRSVTGGLGARYEDDLIC
jgi:hypothetical protein